MLSEKLCGKLLCFPLNPALMFRLQSLLCLAHIVKVLPTSQQHTDLFSSVQSTSSMPSADDTEAV